jgi:hypothetical protein
LVKVWVARKIFLVRQILLLGHKLAWFLTTPFQNDPHFGLIIGVKSLDNRHYTDLIDSA